MRRLLVVICFFVGHRKGEEEFERLYPGAAFGPSFLQWPRRACLFKLVAWRCGRCNVRIEEP